MSNGNIEEKNETLDLHYKNNNRKTLFDVILIYLSDHKAGNGSIVLLYFSINDIDEMLPATEKNTFAILGFWSQ